MSDRCEPPEELRGVDGWHWVQIADWPATVNRWVWDAHEGIGFWHPHISEHTRYLAPVTPPAEVDALRAEASEWCQKAQLFEDRITRLRAELAAAQAIEQAARDFVFWATNNGFTDPENMLVCAEWHTLLAALGDAA